MNTYKIKIKTIGSKTHLVGSVVVIAENKEHALMIAANSIGGATVDCFEEPIMCDHGTVIVAAKSAWEGYH